MRRFFIVVCLVSMFLSCSHVADAEKDDCGFEVPEIVLAEDDFSTSYGRALFLQQKAFIDIAQVLVESGIDKRTIESATKDGDMGASLLNLLDEIPECSKGVEDVIEDILAKYNDDMNEIASELTDGAEVLDSAPAGDGSACVAEDEYQDVNIVDSIYQLEFAKLIGDGMDEGEIESLFDSENEKVLSAFKFKGGGVLADKGLYVYEKLSNKNRGVIYYNFAGVSYKKIDGFDDYRIRSNADYSLNVDEITAVENAMDEWSKATGGDVRFLNVAYLSALKRLLIQSGLTPYRCIDILKYHLDSFYDGTDRRYCEYHSGYLKFDFDCLYKLIKPKFIQRDRMIVIDMSNIEDLARNTYHSVNNHPVNNHEISLLTSGIVSYYENGECKYGEFVEDMLKHYILKGLGQVIGLEPEEHRYDRDSYLSIPKVVPKYALHLEHTRTKKVWVNPFKRKKITYTYVEPISWAVGEFDLNSVMLSPNLSVKRPASLTVGTALIAVSPHGKTLLNSVISDFDVRAVFSILGKGAWTYIR